MEYSRQHAEVYDLIMGGRGKDWAAEAADVAALIRTRHGTAATLLDVACGTGAHLAAFAGLFDDVAGVELSGPMREIAARRVPAVPVHPGDMRDFDLGRTFDAVCCLFCSVGYMPTPPDLEAAIATMARHLAPGGVLVVEPWWFPERYLDGYVAGDIARDGHRVVSRVTHTTRQGRTTRMEVCYVVADGAGMRQFTEYEVDTLFTREEYEAAFARAGCAVEYLEGGPTGRGLFVGVRR